MLKGVVSRVDAQIYVHSRSKGVAHDTLKLAKKGSSHRSPESLMNPKKCGLQKICEELSFSK